MCYLATSVEATHFHLLKRARHVLTETLRVLDFRAICLAHASAASASEDELTILSQLGDLMDRSMASCDGEFDCSSDELNELAVICREEGAIGSRLTGTCAFAGRSLVSRSDLSADSMRHPLTRIA